MITPCHINLGARVILACRNEQRGTAARDDIVEDTDNQNVFLKQLDLSSLQSVRDFAADINSSKGSNYVLQNSS